MILTNRRTRLSHPKVFRGSRGMLLRIPVIEFDDPADAEIWLRAHDFSVFVATPSADAMPYHEVAFPARTAVVVGNERYGVARSWLDQRFARVIVPMLGVADSLNVSVSASILLYAVRTQLAGW